ncbi:MAG TPA: hypothetical protein DCL54_11380 [Alphaproteobacteria bacterium]|nr:hypothetical protein [Alphaproteobacteria bacterium]HAJ47168.1 hypothetical protein [Alphaproteobacteria bacterium]
MVLAAWKTDYNIARPHSALGRLTPAAFAQQFDGKTQRDGSLGLVDGPAPRPITSQTQTGTNYPRTLPTAG